MSSSNNNIQFLKGGGEMGQLIRCKDWQNTLLGNPENWPQSLRTTLGIVLSSKFPMFLWWGTELICFYNDAYRPILGVNRKNLSILGKPAKESFIEIWDIIKPLIDGVLAGEEATWSEDQLIPIYRNGKLEDVYWTFSYSPVNDETGKPAGVLVTYFETIQKTKKLKESNEREDQLNFILDAAELGTWDLNPQTNKFIGNDRLKKWFGLNLSDEIEFSLALNTIAENDKEKVISAIQAALKSGSDGNYNISYTIINPLTKAEYIVVAKGKALFNKKNIAYRFSGTMQDITQQALAVRKTEESEKQFRNMVMQSPIPMTVFRGEDFIIEVANVTMFRDIWHKTECDVIGKKVLDVFPELKDQKYPELLKSVLKSGKSHREVESVVFIQGDKGLKKFYLDYEYAPLFEIDKNVSGILITVNDVTGKVETRRKVEDAEERLRLATEATGIATWDLDLQNDAFIHSTKLADIFGYNKSTQLIHSQLRNQIHHDDKHIVIDGFDMAIKTGILKYEARVVKLNKTICWIRTQGQVFYDENRKPIKLIGTLRDITEEKQYQQELLESEEKFRLLADSMPQFIWTSDADGNLNYFSKSVYDYTGLTPTQIKEEGWLQIVHPNEKEENISKWLHSVKTGEEFMFEHRFRRYDNEYRWQLSRAIPQKNEAGQIQMWVGTSTDIEDQKTFARDLKKQVDARTKELKQLNEELIKSEERYHLMVDEIQDYAIIYLNKEGVIENWNRGAEKIKGYGAEEIIGKNFSIFYTEEDKATNLPQKLLKIALETGKATQEGWRVRKDGSLFWANIVITAIHDEEKNSIGFSKFTHDLTEIKQANDRIKSNAELLELKNKELEKINAELQSFAYVSSHDLQEPLRKIQTFATRILEKEHQNLSDNGKNYFHRMQESANKMQTLIEDLLTYSRTNTTENIFKNTNLIEIINEVKNDFKEVLAEKNATIEVREMCEAIIIPFQFRQLMQNLISNSLKFSKPDIPAHIIIKSEIKGGSMLNTELLSSEKMYCHISISDNGIGFESKYKDRIFEVFQRLHGKAEYKGTGIGLAIVKKIVENHNGIITATGELNRGATFDIYIPS